MTLVELKTSILNEAQASALDAATGDNASTESSSLLPEVLNLVLVCENDSAEFVAEQYVEAICKNRHLELQRVTSMSAMINEADPLSLVFDTRSLLYVIKADALAEAITDEHSNTNFIIICNKIDKKQANSAKLAECCVTIPKLTEWQVQDYLRLICSGLSNDDYAFITKATNTNIWRAVNEVSKLTVFSEEERSKVLHTLRDSKDTDLVSFSVFDLVNAIILKDKVKLCTYLYYRANCDFEPTGVVTLLLSKLKKILFTCFNSGIALAQIGVSNKQLVYIKNEAKLYTSTELHKKIKFLTSIDVKLKTGRLDIPKPAQLDYIITHMM